MDAPQTPPPPLQMLQAPRRKAVPDTAPAAPAQAAWWQRWLDWRTPAAR
jgi:hypothetical protein